MSSGVDKSVEQKVADRLPRQDVRRLLAGRHHAPRSVLGLHGQGTKTWLCVFMPRCREMRVAGGPALTRLEGTDLFYWSGSASAVPERYRVRWIDEAGTAHEQWDPYCFPNLVTDLDLHLFNEGRHRRIHSVLGANPRSVDGVDGFLFATWAPNAERVSVVGEFNDWDGRRHPMEARGDSGIWELFIPDMGPDVRYKFELRTRRGEIMLKSDPYGRRFEMRPADASLTVSASGFQWQDADWMGKRHPEDWQHDAVSIYEVHLGSWRRGERGAFLDYRALAHQLVAHVTELGFTHLELLPITEHPLDASWGYQTTGYFAPTSRFGSPDDFRYFVDYCHRHGIGVIIDWVPAHFPKNRHALAWFDGTALYEHADPRMGEHRDWDTLIFNFGRHEVRNFLIASALFWLEEFHVDGLRVDAVASMLYLDYSREPGDWIPNRYGGNENLEAIAFLRELNDVIHEEHHGVMTFAEESTAWPQVTRPTWAGGLGFCMKWNMGWMHDTLSYARRDPVHRKHHHDELTFSLLYAFHENFVLPFSHDEVVHGKGSMLGKMPGDEWQRFAHLRLVYSYLFTHPGKKLLFMGSEIGQHGEWNHDTEVDWSALDGPMHRGIMRLVADLNHLHRESAPLHRFDFDQRGFDWIDCHDSTQSVFCYARKSESEELIVLLNFTPVPRHGYRIGVDRSGTYREIFNSDSEHYGGTNLGNGGAITTRSRPWMGRAHSLTLTLPPLGALILALP